MEAWIFWMSIFVLELVSLLGAFLWYLEHSSLGLVNWMFATLAAEVIVISIGCHYTGRWVHDLIRKKPRNDEP
jgi:hypothetical protein